MVCQLNSLLVVFSITRGPKEEVHGSTSIVLGRSDLDYKALAMAALPRLLSYLWNHINSSNSGDCSSLCDLPHPILSLLINM